jgi:hypothetical protein
MLADAFRRYVFLMLGDLVQTRMDNQAEPGLPEGYSVIEILSPRLGRAVCLEVIAEAESGWNDEGRGDTHRHRVRTNAQLDSGRGWSSLP